MTLYEFCHAMMHDFNMGNDELRIIDNGSSEIIFTGTFAEFLLRRDFTVGFVSSKALCLSMMLSTASGEMPKYVTMISI